MKKHLIFLFTITLLWSCSSSETIPLDNPNPSPQALEWLIPINEVRDGGPGKDGIPSIDDPKFTNANNVDFLNDDDLVIGIFQNGIARAYPHVVMDWHEVTNDEINGAFFTLNYCPLTGTAFAWESVSKNARTTFGVSGLLYNANLIMYDRNTDSNWSQLGLECVNGELIGDQPKLYNVIETNWATWKTLYHDSQVLNTNTGFSRSYGISPYGDYAVNNERFIFRPAITNPALPNKQRVYTIIDDDKAKVYQFSDFENGKVIRDNFNGNDYLIVGNSNVINAFKLDPNTSNHNFSYSFNNSEVFFSDDNGNSYSIFGNVVSNSRNGISFEPVKSVMSYWFAIAAFYPNPEIYETP
ncbi:DUF3179 domain-containing protein [Seonamhaeicola sp. ML3]|uniref:DUF3179 domain-containing protein n=1 Tax=Seonamhaeicola sp. ML3 TaxID=2937786 RepID=UPI00200DF69E|nr:DUF3179 domain-containing protein [Seonamhaeicola sp. ML3]